MKISVVIPVKNGRPTLRECLEGVLGQETEHELEVLVIDSGSSDGSLDIVREFPVRLIRIDPKAFDHGDTRNMGAAETVGDFIVFFVQDAVPADNRWLARLTDNLVRDDAVAGAFSRVIPRPGCGPLVERGVRGDLNFGSERIEMTYPDPFTPESWNPHDRRIRSNFNDVASALRRSVWESIPYSRTPFGEDIIWADSVLRAGHKVVYDPESVVIHSHEYQPGSIYPRTHIDGWFNKAYFGRTTIEKPGHVLIMTGRQYRDDSAFLAERGLQGPARWKEKLTSLAYHFLEFTGFYLGGRTDEVLPRQWPVTRGSFDLYLALSRRTAERETEWRDALALASALERMGQPVRLLCETMPSSSGAGADQEFRSRFEVIDVPFRSEGSGKKVPNLRPPLDAALKNRKTTVVHALDFSPFSAGILDYCRQEGLPCLVSLNDFWFRCPRGDLFRSDESFCTARKPPRMGCALCQARQAEFIFPALGIDKVLGSLLRTWPALAPFAGGVTRPDRLAALLEAAEFTLVPDSFFLARCLEAGLNRRKIVLMDGGTMPSRIERPASLTSDRPDGVESGGGPEDRPDPDRAARLLMVKYCQALGRAAFRREADRYRRTADHHVA